VLLQGDGLWFDEINGIRISSYDILTLMQWLKFEFSPPLFYLLLHFWIKIVGFAPLLLRVFPFMWGVIGVYVTGVVVMDIYKRKGVALLTAVMVALSPLMVRYSVEVRMYSLLYVMFLVQVMLFFRILRSPSRKYIVLLSFVTVIALGLHHSILFLFMVEVIWALLFYRRELLEHLSYWLLVVVGVTVLYLPVLILTTRYQLFRIGGSGLDYTEFVERNSVVEFYFSLVKTSFFGDTNPILGSITIILVVVLGLMVTKKKWFVRESYKTLLFFIFLSIIPTMFLYVRSGNLGIIRYFLPSVLSVYVIFAMLIENINHHFIKVIVIFCFLISIIGGTFAYYSFRSTVISRHVDKVALFVSRKANRDDVVLLSTPSFKFIFEWYYTGEAKVMVLDPGAWIGINGEVDDQLVLSRGGQQIVTEDNVYLLSGLVSPYKRVWFIDFDRAADPYNIQFNFLLGEYPTVKYVAWDDIQNNTLPGEEIPSFSAVKVFEK